MTAERFTREETVKSLQESNFEFRRAYQKHQELEKKLQELNQIKYVGRDAEVERKRIQKAKLRSKDRMERMILDHESIQT